MHPRHDVNFSQYVGLFQVSSNSALVFDSYRPAQLPFADLEPMAVLSFNKVF